MALSDWDTLAVTFDGNSVPDTATPNANGDTLARPYKNTLQLFDADTTTPFACLFHGSLMSRGLSIHVERCARNGIQGTVRVVTGDPADVRGIVFIACQAHDDPTPRIAAAVGVDLDAHLNAGWEVLGTVHFTDENGRNFVGFDLLAPDGTIHETDRIDETPDLEPVYTGVPLTMWHDLVERLAHDGADTLLPDLMHNERAVIVERLRVATPMRGNQGDAFFAERIGCDDQRSPPDQAPDPLLMRAFREG